MSLLSLSSELHFCLGYTYNLPL